MNEKLLDHIIAICDKKMATKGENVGLSFYAFFLNKNDTPKAIISNCRMVDQNK